MESAALWGAVAALSWGFTDFTARFAGRAVGVTAVLLAIMLAGTIVVVLYIVAAGIPMSWEPDGFWALGIAALSTIAATVLLFDALTRGPVSLASPTVASYPAIAVPITVAFGARPQPIEWIAMACTIAGVWIVARAVARVDGGSQPEYAPAVLRRVLITAIAGAFAFAIAMVSADAAVERYGPEQTLLVMRVTGVVFFAAWFGAQRRRPGLPISAWPLLALLALLDTGGYAAVYLGLTFENGEFAIVASSAYTVVTVVLARFFLREPVTPVLWLGVALVVGGIGALAVLG